MTLAGPDAASPLGRLLDRLAAEGEDGGEAYERLRRLIHRFFEVRGRHDADVLADEVLDRLGRRLDQGTTIEDLGAYARGIARLVLLEAERRPFMSSLEVEPAAPTPTPEDETMDDCLTSCLARLSSDTRQQVIDYYTADGRARIDGRKRLADRLGVSPTGLRLRMLRLRMQLEHCIMRCRGAAPGNAWRPRITSS